MKKLKIKKPLKRATIKRNKVVDENSQTESTEGYSTADETDNTNNEENRLVTIKNGKFVYDIKFGTVKFITAVTMVLIFINTIFSLSLFDSSIRIRSHLGYFINMVSNTAEGAKLPIFQSLPVLIFLIFDLIFLFALWKIFKRKKQRKYNWLLFVIIIAHLALIILTFILLFVIMGHIYGGHVYIHDGIMEAMKNYSSNSLFKKQIDSLQIEFQCCGSKKYDEWYNIQWYDASLIKKGHAEKSNGNTPFSCCSMSSLSPCVHHNIENTGKGYLYTPEQNLSISTTGCHEKILTKTRQVGWKIIGNLLIFIVLQGVVLVGMRLLQTAHYASKFAFGGHNRVYTAWIFGRGVMKNSIAPDDGPPPVPPVPDELK
ncbi:unnamed protein product [Phyllotreta striolata]|uniref:Tetraspanin n=1 Tax=Phyllotreta striolata TaxID=444603 RepID=A0A9N9TN87_PHYSR|nr:unnamed protein product [Phyllotreta striolata]